MAAAPDPSASAVQAMHEAGQAWLQGYRQWLATATRSAAAEGGPAANLAALQQEVLAKHLELWQGFLEHQPGQPAPAVALPGASDRRFSAPEWAESPIHDYLRQAYLINAEYISRSVETMPLPEGKDRGRLRFLMRQYVDAIAPSNFAATNPEVIKKALATGGKSLAEGIGHLIADIEKGHISMSDESAFEVGRNLAVSAGAVVFENELMQLIQYAPLTERVGQLPLVMVPPCINKFYILDLQPENSLVRHALAQGHTVFMVSWVNPAAEQGNLTWDDYLDRGVLTALATAGEICGTRQVNALGFCVGGALLASALAVAKARGEDPVASLTLLATLLDYADTGEIGCFVDEASVAMREATIGGGGLLHGGELAAVFASLRDNDLIWQYVVGNYLLGGTPPAFDLLYWNADSTSLPGPFAAWYLRHLYLENGLRVPGRLSMCGVAVDLRRLDMPAFVYGSREDHIVPWRTAYASRERLGGPTRFVLGTGGHIAGVINPPAQNKRGYWTADAPGADADAWLEQAAEHRGSWWPLWSEWLAGYSGKRRTARRRLGNKHHRRIEPAPGRYVMEKAA